MEKFILQITIEENDERRVETHTIDAADEATAEKIAASIASSQSNVKLATLSPLGEAKELEIPKPVTERVKTFADACREVGTTEEEFNAGCKAANLTPDEVAYRKIKVIVKALNEGWEPDFLSGEQYRYIPWFRVSRRAVCVGGNANSGASAGLVYVLTNYGSSYSNALIGARLCYKSRELAEYAGNQFIEIYHNYLLNDSLVLPTQE